MHHFTRTPTGSAVDVAIAIRVCGRPPDPATAGVTEVSATVAEHDPETWVVTGVQHAWLRDPNETSGDFLAMALAAARDLGLKAVTFSGTAAVPEE
jgi:hypothetical protein